MAKLSYFCNILVALKYKTTVKFPILRNIFKSVQIRGGDKPVFKTYKIKVDYISNLWIYYYRVWVPKKRDEQRLEAAQWNFWDTYLE